MEISTQYSSAAASGLASSTTPNTNPVAVDATSGANMSLFGPAALVALGASDGISVGGYSNLIPSLQTVTGTDTGWQFNLAGVMNAATPTVQQTPVSPEQQKREDAQVQAALDLLNQGAFDDARKRMNDLLDKNGGNAAAVDVLGLIEQGQGNYDKAQQYFLKASALDPTAGYDHDASNARILKGSDKDVLAQATAFLKAADKHDDGVRLLMILTERTPDYTDAHIALGDALLDSGDGTNGLMQFSNAIRSADTNQLSALEGKLNDLIQGAPQATFVRELLGRVQIRQGRYDDAVQTLNAAAKLATDPTAINGDLAQAYVGVGQEKLAVGDVAGALATLKNAKKLSPTNTDVKNALAAAYIKHAGQLGGLNDANGALDDYTQASALLGTTGGSKALRAQAAQSAYTVALHLQRERIASGSEIDAEVGAFQAAYDFDPSNATYRHKLADARVALGDQFTADDDLKSAAGAYQRAYELVKSDANKAKAIGGWTAWGDYRLANLNYDDGVDAYLAAFKLDQNNLTSKTKLAGAYNARGLDYKSWDKNTKAVQDFKSALRLFPDNAEYQANYDSVRGWDL